MGWRVTHPPNTGRRRVYLYLYLCVDARGRRGRRGGRDGARGGADVSRASRRMPRIAAADPPGGGSWKERPKGTQK